MNYRLVRRNIHAPVSLRAGKAKHMIIFVDRSANRAQRIVAVRKNVRNWKFLQSGCPGSLNDSYICDIM